MSDKIPVKNLIPESIEGKYEGVGAKLTDKLYVRSVHGFFNKLRNVSLWAFMLAYFVVPWVNLDGQQAVLFDLPARQFHIWGLTLWPQDLVLLSFLLIICAFGLFTITCLLYTSPSPRDS